VSRDRQNLGRWGEDEAARYLQQQGMKVLERNLKTPVGEIDILARKGRYLVFVEVKTRRSSGSVLHRRRSAPPNSVKSFALPNGTCPATPSDCCSLVSMSSVFYAREKTWRLSISRMPLGYELLRMICFFSISRIQ